VNSAQSAPLAVVANAHATDGPPCDRERTACCFTSSVQRRRRHPRVGLVLSGGGARGAYEAGVLAGLEDVLGGSRRRGPRFDVVTGTSVGAINVAHAAGSADLEDHGVQHLVQLWTSLQVETHLRPRLRRFVACRENATKLHLGRALLDARPFERLVEHEIRWPALHENVRRGVVEAVIVSALNIANGRTVSFVETTPGVAYVSTQDASRTSRRATLSSGHVLASAAIPLLFPARRIGDSYFCDGGLRFNTPISPAIRAGAERLVVVALRAARAAGDENAALEQYPNPIFLLGKVFDALLLDPIDRDLQMLERLNQVVEVLEQELGPEAFLRVDRVLEADRGLPYRHIETLVFRPTEDIGVLALEHLRAHRTKLCRPGATSAVLLENLASLGARVEADVLSFLLFDGRFARTLIELGKRDVRQRAAEVEAFFAPQSSGTSEVA